MQIACACASASIASSRPIAHSMLSCAWSSRARRSGRAASSRAPSVALPCCSCFGGDEPIEEAPALAFLGAHRAAGEEQLGRAALADDARQDRARAHVAAGEADAREEERGLRAPASRGGCRTPSRGSRRRRRTTPSTAATIGCGQARIALTRSPVMRVNASSSGSPSPTSGPMISCTSPPEQKLPPAAGHDGADVRRRARAPRTSRAARRRARRSAGFLRSPAGRAVTATRSVHAPAGNLGAQRRPLLPSCLGSSQLRGGARQLPQVRQRSHDGEIAEQAIGDPAGVRRRPCRRTPRDPARSARR